MLFETQRDKVLPLPPKLARLCGCLHMPLPRSQSHLLSNFVTALDQVGAAMLLVEIGCDMSVFGSAQRLASWVGMCPGNNESAGKRKSGRIRKGNAWMRRLLRAQRQVSGVKRAQRA